MNRSILTLALCSLFAVWPGLSFAQDEINPAPAASPLSSTTTGGPSSSSTTSTLMVSAPMMTLGGIIMTIVRATRPEKGHAVHLYLDANQREVIEAVSVGWGEGVDDLAELYDLPRDHAGAFGVQLRAHRAELLELVNDVGVSAEQSQSFDTIVRGVLAEMRQGARASIR